MAWDKRIWKFLQAWESERNLLIVENMDRQSSILKKNGKKG